MKKLGIILMATLVSTVTLADKIGYVNSQEIFARYSQTKIIQEKLNKELARLEKEVKQKEIALQKNELELKAKGNVTEAEKKQFQAKVEAFQKFVRDSQTKLGRERDMRMEEIEGIMINAISSVAKSGKYDYVLEAGAIKFGGKNITNDVLKAMESANRE